MTPFRVLRARAVPIAIGMVDTDQIIPARFLKRPRGPDHARLLFHDRRFAPDGAAIGGFPLDRPEFAGAAIMISADEFGTGSAREQAVWALCAQGISCVLAPRFGAVFRENAIRNGLLPVALPRDLIAALIAGIQARPAAVVVIDLPAQHVVDPVGAKHGFDIDPFEKLLLIEGLDELSFTSRNAGAIAAFERAYADSYPWMAPRPKA